MRRHGALAGPFATRLQRWVLRCHACGGVCREMARILRPGGRVAISDVVRTQELPERLLNEAALAC